MTTTDTRTLLMDAFSDQLAAVGYSGISLVGVARTAGIRKPSIYHHFPGGKEELYASVATRFIDTAHARIADALASGTTFEERLAALVRAAAEHAGATISFEQRVYDALDLVSASTRNRISTRYVEALLSPVVALFREAVGEGRVTGDPEFLMNAFLHLARAVDLSSDDDAPRIVDLFLNGARPRNR
ncbi:TetR/AcrR family transcriptional regulator [Microbispora sp. H11081]|uniref:TetR/AcrR family transcriptional regulator n=1 Tax=Microbispora sp. H11081 TaxID=2729107 RepID=UPI001475A390|nr:TetR/AcrR family transcriptional regulator [Microbispora sp. H11081]